MKPLLGILLGLSTAVGVASQKTAAAPTLFSEIDGICRDLETITGLKFARTVPSAVIDKKQLRAFLNQRVDKAIKPADLKAESLTLKMLGLIPQDFDLRQETVDLLTEQAAAFYDYKKKKLFLLEGGTGDAALMALAHELAHALADQNFHLEKYIKEDTESDDAATARMAVMEGQATWLMSAYLHLRAGLGADVPKPVMDMMSGSVEESASQYPVYSQAPLYIRESLVFPYKGGMAFQDAVYRKMGKQGFAEVFRRAPVSTQQVLHPEKYLDQIGPQLPQAPAIPSQKSFRKLAEGTLGEFDFRVLLTQYGSSEDAGSLDPALRGSQFSLFENKQEKYPVLAFATKWDSAGKAREFFTLYHRILKAKSEGFAVAGDSEDTLSGRNAAGFFRVICRGDTVESIEGLKSSLN